MERMDEIVRLLEEIRDTGREHLAEYRRRSEQLLELNRLASERAAEQSRDAAAQQRATVKVWNALWWAITVLIAICLGSLLIILQEVHN